MGYLHCDKHDQDATNGCEACTDEDAVQFAVGLRDSFLKHGLYGAAYGEDAACRLVRLARAGWKATHGRKQ